MKIRLESRNEHLDYERFTRLNDLCFPHALVSPYEFQTFLAASTWVVYDQEAPIGYAVMSHHEDRAHIRRIGVHPDYRRQGLGMTLMESMLEKAVKLVVNLVDLMVQQDNAPAIRLYEKYNFQITDESIQFATPNSPMEAEGYSVIPLDRIQNRTDFGPYADQLRDWAAAHHPPEKWVLVFYKRGTPIGFTRFSPDFPGCSPFELFNTEDVEDILTLVSQIHPYTLPGKKTIKITTNNPKAISLLKRAGIPENYRLYQMVKILRP